MMSLDVIIAEKTDPIATTNTKSKASMRDLGVRHGGFYSSTVM